MARRKRKRNGLARPHREHIAMGSGMLIHEDAAAEYSYRNRVIRELGFKDYRQYLDSETWASIRSRVLRDGQQCTVCNQVATHVHHEKYTWENLSGENVDHLRPVCGACHRRCEFNNKMTKKFGPSQATIKMDHRHRMIGRNFERSLDKDMRDGPRHSPIPSFQCPRDLVQMVLARSNQTS